jgi:predicted nucleotidyltransferase
MLKKEYEILYVFMKDPWKRFAFREIKDISGKTSDSYIYQTLKHFVELAVLKIEKAGNVILYSLNINHLKSRIYAGLVAEHIAWNKKRIPYDIILEFASRVPATYYTLLVTGSYAHNKQKKDSDMDLVIICEDTIDTKTIYAELSHYSEMSIPPIHLYVFKKSDFLKMLLDKKANYGKEIVKNLLIFTGATEYYNIINEAMKNGFNG